MATAKANIDPVFEKRITALIDSAKANAAALEKSGATEWNMPPKGGSTSEGGEAGNTAGSITDQPGANIASNGGGWDGDLFKSEGFTQLFTRERSNQEFVAAVTSGGVTGDCGLASLQVDYTAAQERAFRARHTMRRPRAVAHAMARLKGHGNNNGPFGQCILDYLRGIMKQSRQQGG